MRSVDADVDRVAVDDMRDDPREAPRLPRGGGGEARVGTAARRPISAASSAARPRATACRGARDPYPVRDMYRIGYALGPHRRTTRMARGTARGRAEPGLAGSLLRSARACRRPSRRVPSRLADGPGRADARRRSAGARAPHHARRESPAGRARHHARGAAAHRTRLRPRRDRAARRREVDPRRPAHRAAARRRAPRSG